MRDTVIGFLGLLGGLFIALKLMGYISWSWLWVASPFWIMPLAAVFFGLILLIRILILKSK